MIEDEFKPSTFHLVLIEMESIFKKKPRHILAILGTFGLISNVIFAIMYCKRLGWKRMLIDRTILAVELVIFLATMVMVRHLSI